jgi:hypothetical protein
VLQGWLKLPQATGMFSGTISGSVLACLAIGEQQNMLKLAAAEEST